MTTVLLGGGKLSRRIFDFLGRAVAPAVPVSLLGHRTVLCAAPEILAAELPEAVSIRGEHTAVVLSEPDCFPALHRLGESVVILNTIGGELPPGADHWGKVITCGLGMRDTLTFSSLTREGAVVSLGRSLRDFSGAWIEPEEFPLALGGPREPFFLLAAVAILLVSGQKGLISRLTF